MNTKVALILMFALVGCNAPTADSCEADYDACVAAGDEGCDDAYDACLDDQFTAEDKQKGLVN